jgi:hypothetical protein
MIIPHNPQRQVFSRFGARKKAQFFIAVLDPGGFGAFSEIGPAVDSEVRLAIYSRVIPIGLLAIEAQSIAVSRVEAYLEYCGVKSYR